MADCPDGRCDGTGFLYDEERRRAHPCTCRPGRIAKRRAAAIAGRIPKRYRGVGFDREPFVSIERANPEQVRVVRSYVRSITANLTAGRGMWFTGDIGTGKTALAMLISRTAIEADHTVAIYSLPRLLALLRETYGDSSRYSLNGLIERLSAVDLLHIDDVGAEQTTEWVLEQLYTIVNTRYEDGKALLLTTNLVGKELTPSEIEAIAAAEPDERERKHPSALLRLQIGKRTASRLYEICGEPLPLFGHDNRMDASLRMHDTDEAPRGWDPFDDSTWEDDPSPYGRPRPSA
jgi:DNA replication protein DnaC